MKRMKSFLLLNFVLFVNLIIAVYFYMVLNNILLFLLIYIIFLIPVNTVFLFHLLNKTDYVLKLSKVLVIRFPNDKSMRLHLVSHFEIIKLLFTKRKSKSIKRFIYSEIIFGIFALKEFLENKDYKDAEVTAIAHYFNEKTMNKMGFINTELDLANKIRFFADFPAMLVMNFFIYKKANISKIRQVRKAVTNYAQLNKSLESIKKQYMKIGDEPDIIKKKETEGI
jgi:hypothetical protein